MRFIADRVSVAVRSVLNASHSPLNVITCGSQRRDSTAAGNWIVRQIKVTIPMQVQARRYKI